MEIHQQHGDNRGWGWGVLFNDQVGSVGEWGLRRPVIITRTTVYIEKYRHGVAVAEIKGLPAVQVAVVFKE